MFEKGAEAFVRMLSDKELDVTMHAVISESRRRDSIKQQTEQVEQLKTSDGPTWDKDTPNGPTRPSNQAAVDHERRQGAAIFGEAQGRMEAKGPENPFLSHKYRRRVEDEEDDRQGERLADQVLQTRGIDGVMTMAMRMACRHDVRIHRLRQDLDKALDSTSRRLAGLIQKLDQRRAEKQAVFNAHSDAINHLDSEIQTIKSNIKNVYALIERQNVNIGENQRAHNELNNRVNGPEGLAVVMHEVLTEQVALKKQVRALQSRLAKDWDKKRR